MEAGVQTTTGPVVISKQGMLNDLGVSLMAASAYRHCLATETPDITTSEGGGQIRFSLIYII